MFDFQKECGLELIKDMVATDKTLSRIYGFILYTEKDPYVVKVLRDNDFWKALNSISGSNWPVFAVRPLQKGQVGFSGSRPGCMSYMVPTWEEPKANLPIIRDFGLKDSSDLPLFVAFTWDDNDDLQQIAIPIRGTDTDSVYQSIELIVQTISQTEDRILDAYKKTPAVFREVAKQLDALDFSYTIAKRGKILMKMAEFFSVFM